MKRDPKTDSPRRIYQSTIDRINEHLKNYPRTTKKPSTRKGENKGDFNKFLELLLDSYEGMLNAPRLYANDLYEDVAEARGEAIKKAIKNKTTVSFPVAVVIVGADDGNG